ncbi:MAG: NAD(P)/FAD-dependent oxidoreductase, partial [Leptospiraceae bacterium]|nr:NAD(P)/FAD-dependent oxidoreductase [Leptospiraceae bacterium]
FRSPELRAVLASQWGDYGLPPSQSAFAIHALIVSHYLDGAYYPVGGAGTLAHSIVPQLEQFGGKALLYQDVKEILTENGRVRGVRVQHRQGDATQDIEYLAPMVISDAGLKNTMLRMLPKADLLFKKELEDFSQGTSNVTLYLGLKESPSSLGLNGANLWIYDSLDHDRNFADRNRLLHGKPPAMYASFPSMKDPAARSHTAELISFLDYHPFSDWSAREWKNRGAEYDELKLRMQNHMLERMDDVVPGFSNLVSYAELSTPLTNEHFSGHPRGSIYGLACIPERFKKKWIGINTPIKGLYITGADAASPGFAGAMMGGFGCAARILGFGGIRKLFQEMGHGNRV